MHKSLSFIRRINLNFLLSSLIVVLVLIYFHVKGFIPYDEGWFVYAGERFLQGQVPYRDFQFIYNPGGIYLSALSLFVFGKSILATRILALMVSLISVSVIYLFGKRLKVPFFVTLLIILNFVFWGPGQVNFIWPVMFSIFSGFLTLYFLYLATGTKNEKNTLRFLLLAGVFSGITFLFKQNFGLAIAINDLLFFIFLKDFRNFRLIGYLLLGFLSVLGIQAVYMLFTDSLVIYLKDFYYFMFIKIVKDGMLASNYPWQFPSPIPYQILKIVFYFLPVILSLISLAVIFMQNKKMFFIPTFVILFYFLSIRPTTDYIHLTPLIAISFLPLMVIFNQAGKKLKLIISIFIFIFLVFGIYSSLFRNYYRWNEPLINENYLLSIPHSLILTDQGTAEKARTVVEFIDNHTKKGEPIFIYGLNPMYYLLSERDNPTRYDYFRPGVQDEKSVDETIKILEKDKVKLIISDSPLNGNISKDQRYILSKYKEINISNNYFYLRTL